MSEDIVPISHVSAQVGFSLAPDPLVFSADPLQVYEV